DRLGLDESRQPQTRLDRNGGELAEILLQAKVCKSRVRSAMSPKASRASAVSILTSLELARYVSATSVVPLAIDRDHLARDRPFERFQGSVFHYRSAGVSIF